MTAINPQAVRGPVTAVPVVAGTGVRFREDVENNRVVAEVDETVLWSSTTGAIDEFTLSEATSNFERIRIYWIDWTSYQCEHVQEFGAGSRSVFTLSGTWAGNTSTIGIFSIYLQANAAKTTLTTQWTKYIALNNTSSVNTTSNERITKIVGVNRIASA